MNEIRPVKKTRLPGYPDKSEALKNPKLLKKLPDRWKQCKYTLISAGLLSSAGLLLCACEPEPPALAGVPLPPKMVTESDAMAMIKSISAGFFAHAQPCDAKDIEKPLSYIRYDVNSKDFLPVSPLDEKEIQIDAYDSMKGIGLEYLSNELKTENETQAFNSAGEALEHADKQNAYILVVDEAYEDGQKENAAIKAQIEAFVNWLKAEGII